MEFTEMMDLAQHGPDTLVGIGPRYPWGGLYGGQIVAQSLRAAATTVDPAYRVHSLHAYFIRMGDHAESIRFEVERLRNGRSFVTRSVIARQSTGAILNMAASFQRPRDDDPPFIQTARAPEVPGPTALADRSWSTMFERRIVDQEPGHAVGWLRMRGVGDDDEVLGACALAYLSDDLATDGVRSAVESASGPLEAGVEWRALSLDHAIWFHHPVATDAWQLHASRGDGIRPPRGLSVGRVFDPAGIHVATVNQEVLIRQVRPPAEDNSHAR